MKRIFLEVALWVAASWGKYLGRRQTLRYVPGRCDKRENALFSTVLTMARTN